MMIKVEDFFKKVPRISKKDEAVTNQMLSTIEIKQILELMNNNRYFSAVDIAAIIKLF